MKRIYKYNLDGFVAELELTVGYHGLKIGVQKENIVVWVMVDDEVKEKVKTTFRIYGTGDAIKNHTEMNYVDTVQVGTLVWHIFKDSKDVSL